MKEKRILRSSSLLFLSLLCQASADFQTFEGDGFGTWQATGKAFGLSPVHGKLDGMDDAFSNFSNDAFAASVYGGNKAIGTLTSPEFTIEKSYIVFGIAGGDQVGKTSVQLLVGGEVVRESTGSNSMAFKKQVWNVNDFKGKEAVIRAVDEAKGEWGFIALDHVMLTDWSNPKLPSSTKDGKPYAEGLVATQVLPGATIPAGSTLKIEATFDEQRVTSPTALTFDEKGNIYISETHRFRHGIEDDRNHLYWYLDDLQAQKTEDRRQLHKKWESKLSEEYMTEVSEVIRRLSDTNGDGNLDGSTVFADGFNDVLDGTAAGVFFYDGCLYFACIPKIYKLRDTDGDGSADEQKVVEEGFGVRISLSGHDLNGFTLGPDGMIYGTIGDRGFSILTQAGKELHYPNEGAVFRFEPDGSGFELMHTGLRNPKEIAFDEFGNAFTVDNNSDQGDAARVVYLVEGGDSGWQMEHQAMHTFHRQIGLEKRPPSRWMNERMWDMENDVQPAYILPPSAHLSSGPSGLTYHPGAGFLESEKGRFLICDYKGGAAVSGIWSFAMEPDGAGMAMSDARKFHWGIAATDVEYSFDGRVYVTDFVTGWESHEAGRLVSLDAGENLYLPEETEEAAKVIAEGFDQRSSTELGKLLAHADSRVRIRAQVALTRKKDAVQIFEQATQSDELLKRVHGVWGLGIVARRGFTARPAELSEFVTADGAKEAATKILNSLLNDEDAEIQVQALRAISRISVTADSLNLAKFLKDDSMRVRFEAGIAIGKLKLESEFQAVLDFLEENDNKDVYLRHAGIYALEHITSDPAKLGALTKSDHPEVRLAAVVALRRLGSGEVARFITDRDPKVQDEAIRAVGDLNMVPMRPLVAALLDDLGDREWTPFMLRRLITNAYRSGGIENAERLLQVAENRELPEQVRTEALRLISEWVKPHPVNSLTAHWSPLEERRMDSFKPALVTALLGLLKNDGFIVTATLGLVDQYGLDVSAQDPKMLLSLIMNKKMPDEARSRAILLHVKRNEPGLTELLVELSKDSSDQVALTALRAFAEIDPETALSSLRQAVLSESDERTQEAWSIVAKMKGAEPADLIASHLGKLKENDGVSSSAIELLAAAKERKEAQVKEALKAFEDHVSSLEKPSAKFNIALKGGDVNAGRALFRSHPAGQCMRCHKFQPREGSAGGEAGPNLAGIGQRHDLEYLLESLVDPGATVAAGYGLTSIKLKNGASLGGNLIEEIPDTLTVSTPDKTFKVKRSDIESFTPPVSAMPPMGQMLKPNELRDLVAWLDSLKKSPPKKESLKAEMLDPDSLLNTN
ncbi:MAG: HEAT repeat domain-containing protein [Akkermansiaceae bacterium]